MLSILSTLAALTALLQQSVTMDATYYHRSLSGNQMACVRGDTYNPYDPTIAAVGYNTWACGTELLISGTHGDLVVTVRDRCPGCGSRLIDLSESGVLQVCGGVHTCRNVQVTKL